MTNLLIDFLKYVSPAQKELLSSLSVSGREEQVWLYVLDKAETGDFVQEKALAKLDITLSHFHKTCSNLLTKCYALLVPQGGLALLTFLNSNTGWIKHFYNEESRQLKQLRTISKSEAQAYLRACISLHINIPVMLRNDVSIEKVAQKFLSFSSPTTKKEDTLFIAYHKIWFEIDSFFAAGEIEKKEASISKKLDQLRPDFTKVNDEIIFQYYWTLIYLKHSAKHFDDVIHLTEDALKVKYGNKENTIRLQLKRAEALYYASRFEESYELFHKLLYPSTTKIPDQGYFVIKYLQICLITGHLDEVKNWIEQIQNKAEGRFKETLITRDIIMCAKYLLFTEEYEAAFDYIRLGYIKNPKAKYFQYEVELRCLETAYFYLSGNPKQATLMCERHLKYLRTRGYGVKESIYSRYFVFIKAAFENKYGNRKIRPKEYDILNEYKQGSRAVYGYLLQKITEV